MTEPLPLPVPGGTTPESAPPRSAGALLRAAREREGLHLAVLAATIKVSPAKLDALEKDRYDELPNATFARALAQSVCRSLKIDPRPVLALLPQQDNLPLESAVGRLNTPFNERPSRTDGSGLVWASKPMFWAGGVLLVAAVALALMPREWVEGRRIAALDAATSVVLPASPAASIAEAAASVASPTVAAPASAPAAQPTPPPAARPAVSGAMDPTASASALGVDAPAPASRPVPAAPAVPASLPASTPALPARAGALQLSATAPSWIEVLDGEGQSLLSRVVQPGETVSLDGRRPLRLRVGNAGGTQVSYRGSPLDLTPYTRDNVARVELR